MVLLIKFITIYLLPSIKVVSIFIPSGAFIDIRFLSVGVLSLSLFLLFESLLEFESFFDTLVSFFLISLVELFPFLLLDSCFSSVLVSDELLLPFSIFF